MDSLTPELLHAIMSDRATRVALARQSHYYFFNFYFGHYVTYPTADFHRRIFAITEDATSLLDVIVAFRGSGKSTLVSLSDIAWAILGWQEKKFVLILSQTQNQARQLLAHVKYELESNQLLMNDFGRTNLGIGEWSRDAMTIGKNKARIMAASAEQSVRGLRHMQYRPDLIIADDVEDVNSTRTREGRNKTFNWFMGEIIPAGDTNTKAIVIGNLLHEDALLPRLEDHIARKKLTGNVHHFPLLDSRGRSLWPGKYPDKTSITALKKKVGDEVSWQREFLLNIVPDIDQVIDRRWLHYYTGIPSTEDKDSKHRQTAIGIDLAISEKDTADYTAAVTADVFGYGEDMKIYIHKFPFNKRINFPAQRKKIKTLSEQYDQPKLYIESVSYQIALVEQLKQDGVYNVEAVTFPGQDKRSRLALVSHYIKNSQVLFPKSGAEELISQLVGFGVERHDDLADAFSLLILKIIEDYGGSSGGFAISGGGRMITAGYRDMVF